LNFKIFYFKSFNTNVCKNIFHSKDKVLFHWRQRFDVSQSSQKNFQQLVNISYNFWQFRDFAKILSGIVEVILCRSLFIQWKCSWYSPLSLSQHLRYHVLLYSFEVGTRLDICIFAIKLSLFEMSWLSRKQRQFYHISTFIKLDF
jgi:hypothetical protein